MTPENTAAFMLRRLDALLTQGAALIEARKNPVEGAKAFPNFPDDYQDWHLAGRDLIGELSGPSAARNWVSRWCRAMCTLDQNAAMCLEEHERQQAMLMKLRDFFAPELPIPADGKKPYERGLTNMRLLADLRRVAKELGKKTVTAADYRDKGRFSSDTIIKRYGTWNSALASTGLAPGRARDISAEELFQNLARVAHLLGRQPMKGDVVKPMSLYCANVYTHRFGSWAGALKAFVAWSADGTLPPQPALPRKLPPLVSPQMRHAIFKRDGYKCTDCGRSPATTPGLELVVDHILPRIEYGPTTYENLRTLCRECNAGKSDG